jgi:hypothetical protein
MTLPPCYEPDEEEPDNPSRRSFMIGSAAATAGLLVAPLLGEEALKNCGRHAAGRSERDPGFAQRQRKTAGKRVRDLPITIEKLM